jgi:predicted RNA binding protein YcfA (HicA-like mRNA interferase family)
MSDGLLKALGRDGWAVVRQSGSHVIRKHATKPGRVVVARHAEAVAMAKDAIQLCIESLVADGEPVPEEENAPLQVMTVTVEAPAA